MIPTCQVLKFFGGHPGKDPYDPCGEPAAFVFSYHYQPDSTLDGFQGKTYQCAECHKDFPEVPGVGNVHPEPWRKL